MPQAVTDQPGFILHRRDFRNTSLILEVFTLHHGRLGMVARGARKSRSSAHFQPFNQLSLSWSGRAELKTLTHIESQPLQVAADCYLGAFYVNELLLYLLPREDAHVEVFCTYQALLSQLDKSNMEPQLRKFEINLLTQLGLMPELSVQSDSGLAVLPEGRYSVLVDSGVVALRPGDRNAFSGRELVGIQQQRFDDRDILHAGRRLMRQIIDFNLQGRTLQSRKLYQQMYQSK